jgi:hypothetical protein
MIDEEVHACIEPAKIHPALLHAPPELRISADLSEVSGSRVAQPIPGHRLRFGLRLLIDLRHEAVDREILHEPALLARGKRVAQRLKL